MKKAPHGAFFILNILIKLFLPPPSDEGGGKTAGFDGGRELLFKPSYGGR